MPPLLPICVALDCPIRQSINSLLNSLDPSQCWLKVGPIVFNAYGPQIIADIRAHGFDVFLDLKFHDIPNTVASAVEFAASMDVKMLTVHAAGGKKMLQAAVCAARQSQHKPAIVAVTALTSLTDPDLQDIGCNVAVAGLVQLRAKLAIDSGCSGVVASPLELVDLRKLYPKTLLVTPGIRWQQLIDDQARTATPKAAIANGATYLVIGRPITAAKNPSAVVEQLNSELEICTR